MKVFIAGKDFSQYFVGLPMREVGDTIKGHAADCGIELEEMVITVEDHEDTLNIDEALELLDDVGDSDPDVGN